MTFLNSLDIDGISEHSQLFSLSYDKVNKIISNSIHRRIQNINVREMLGDSVFHPLDTSMIRDTSSSTQPLSRGYSSYSGYSGYSGYSDRSKQLNENLNKQYDYRIPVGSMERNNNNSLSSVKRDHPEEPSDDECIDLVTSSDSVEFYIPGIADYSKPKRNSSLNDDYDDDSIVLVSDNDPEDDEPVQTQNPPTNTHNTTYSPSRINDTTIYPVYDDSDSSDESLDLLLVVFLINQKNHKSYNILTKKRVCRNL